MTPYTKQIVELHKIHKAIENCGCNKDEQGGGNEKVAFEDWKRNPYAFPVTDTIHFQNNPAEFYITTLNINFQGHLGGTILGISNNTILSYDSTLEELFNINYNDFKEVTDETEYRDILNSIVLTNDAAIEERKEEFSITDDIFENFINKYNLSYLEANTVTNQGNEIAITSTILLIRFVDKDDNYNTFYTTGLMEPTGGGR